MSKNKLTIAINGRQYTLVSEESPEYLRKLAEHINEKVTFVRKFSSNTMGERPVILAALNICDEYFKAMQGGSEMEQYVQKMNQKYDEVVSENQRLHEMFDNNEFEIDIKTLQGEVEKSKVIIAQRDDKIRHLENSLEALRLKHEKDIENLKKRYEKEN